VDLLGVELGGGELRQQGEHHRPWEVGEARRCALRALKAAAESRVRTEVGVTERRLPDRRARIGALASGAHRSVSNILSLGFE
jgi:hypothetical protein